MTMKKVLDL